MFEHIMPVKWITRTQPLDICYVRTMSCLLYFHSSEGSMQSNVVPNELVCGPLRGTKKVYVSNVS
jgi:hypothetical protein